MYDNKFFDICDWYFQSQAVFKSKIDIHAVTQNYYKFTNVTFQAG